MKGKLSTILVAFCFVSLCICDFVFSAEMIRRNISWTLEGQNDPILQVTNEGPNAKSVQIRILIGDSTYRYPSEVEIPSGENRFIRIREVLDQIGRRYSEVLKASSGILQMELEGPDAEVKTRIVNLNPKVGITSERETESVPTPSIRSVQPDSGSPAGGTVITIVGANFQDLTAVRLGGVPLLHQRQSDTVLVAVTPPHPAGQVDVEVSNGSRTARLKGGYRYESEAPVILSLEPEKGPARGGTRVLVRGRNFQPGALVRWNNTPVLTRFQGTDLLSIITPAGRSGTVRVDVVNPDAKYFDLPDAFQYKGSPEIISLSPEMGSPAGGYMVTINGNNFEPGCSVLFGSHYGQTTYISPAALAATVPPGESGFVDVTVTNAEGEKDTLSNSFLYNDPPKINSISAVPNPVVRNTTSLITVDAIDPEAGLLDYEYKVMQGLTGTIVSAEGDHATYRSPNVTGTSIIQVTVYDEYRAKSQGIVEIGVE